MNSAKFFKSVLASQIPALHETHQYKAERLDILDCKTSTLDAFIHITARNMNNDQETYCTQELISSK